MERIIGFVGLFALLAIAYLLSNNRRAVNWRTVGVGVGLQIVFALIVLRTRPGEWLFEAARSLVARILTFTDYGAYFVFGNLYLTSPTIARNIPDSIPPAFAEGFSVTNPGTGGMLEIGTVFALHVLPTIIFFGALMAMLYHLGVMQWIVRGFAYVMTRTMRTSGAESLSAASNIFVGMSEAPFVVKPFLAKMTSSEIMAVMTAGFATVAGGVMAAYVRFGVDPGHLMAASVMSAPAALVMAKLMIPETEQPTTGTKLDVHSENRYSNLLDAAAGGAADGLRLAVTVAAMLIAFIAIIAMINAFLGWMGGLAGIQGLSLRMILGYLFSPIAFLMGVNWQDALQVGYLMGAKISINEFVAYIDLVGMRDQISARSFTIATYALCGFANIASIAIQIGGISVLVPERRKDLARYGARAMIAGALASFQTATIAGILLH